MTERHKEKISSPFLALILRESRPIARKSLFILLATILLVEIGCQPTYLPSQPSPTRTASLPPSLTALPSQMPTYLPTPTPSVSSTPTATLVPTLIPTITRAPATLTPIPSPESVTSSPTPLIMPPLTGRIVYQNHCIPQRLEMINLDGTGWRILIDKDYNPDKSDQRGLEYTHPSWSPDGRWIAFSSDFTLTGGQIFVIKADGSQVKQLTRYYGLRVEEPAWSPDGQKIAFTLEHKIYVMNADGSEVHQLMRAPLFQSHPAWSPDGKKIAFFTQKTVTTHALSLFTVNEDGTGQKLVIGFGDGGGDTAWAPDGKRIAFIGTQGKTFTLFTVELDGSNLTPFTDSDWEAYNPSYSPDGKWIIVYARPIEGIARGEGWDLRLINVQTKNMTLFVTQKTGCVDQPAWSPVPSLESGGTYTITAWGSNLNLRGRPHLEREYA